MSVAERGVSLDSLRMKLARFLVTRVVPVILILAAGVIAWPKGGSEAPPGATDAKSVGGLALVKSPAHRAQIERVIEAMDRTGKPPRGVVQGGRRGAQTGVFQNAEGRLPRQRQGYWIESDVWPKDGPRDAERLVFGREGEVYWTRDHYETFVRLR